MVSDNCSTNQATATTMGVPLIGYASNRLHLATDRVLKPHESSISAVSALMTAPRLPENRTALAQHTDLAPLRANATGWSSTFAMLERYARIREAAKQVDAVFDLIPKAAAHRRI